MLKALGKLDGPMLYSGPSGRLRASLRQLDPDRSTPVRPFHTYTERQPLEPGQIVPVEISLLPLGLRFHAGQTLRLIVSGYDLKGPMLPELPKLETNNRGEHIIHTGPGYDSHILVPIAAG